MASAQSTGRTSLDSTDSHSLGLTDWWGSSRASADNVGVYRPSTQDHRSIGWMGQDPYLSNERHPVRHDPFRPNAGVYSGHHGNHALTGLYHSATQEDHRVGPYFDRVDRHNRHERPLHPVPLGEHELTDRYRPMGPDPSPAASSYLPSRAGGGIGNRQHSAPVQHNTHTPQLHPPGVIHPSLMSHSYDFIDDSAMEESANSWIQDLTEHTEVEHHRPYRGTTLAAPPGMTRPQGMHHTDNRGNHNKPQQRSPRTERHQRHQAPAAAMHSPSDIYHPPHSSNTLPQHYQHTATTVPHQHGHINPLSHDSTGYNPFSRPESFPQRTGSVTGSPRRDTEIDQWMSLNATTTTGSSTLSHLRAGPGAGSSLLLSPQQNRTLPSYTHSPPYPQYAQQYNSPHHSPSDHAAIVADLQFFHPNSFFGELSHNNLPLESLEDEKD